jgi:hypothetical protein
MPNDDVDKLFGRLHDFAELDPHQLQERYCEENIDFLREIVSKCWRGRTVPNSLSRQEFVDLIYALKSGESEWSKKLGAMLIASEDRMREGRKEKVAEYFEYFLEHCPCISLSAIAEIEKNNFGV